MSVNLHLGVVVRDYRRARIEHIRNAVQKVLIQEEIAEDLPPLIESTDDSGLCLISRSDPMRPVIITGAYEWAMRVEKSHRDGATDANGATLSLNFIWDDADEGREDEEDEDDELE